MSLGVILVLAIAGLATARPAYGGQGAFTTAYADHTFSQVVVDNSNSHVAYAAGNDGSQNVFVYKTFDGGQTFANTAAGLGQFTVSSMVVARIDPQTLYIGGNNATSKQALLYVTHNGGGTWTAVGTALGTLVIQAMVVDPTIANTVYLGTNSGIYKSIDGGQTFNSLTGMAGKNIRSLAYDRNTPTDYFAGTDASTSPGVWKSSDGGNTWASASTGLPASQSVLLLSFDSSSTQTLYAGLPTSPYSLAKSTNAGATWTVTNTPSEAISSMAVDPLNGNNVYMATASSMWRSSDGGLTFVAIYAKGSGPVAVDGASPQDLFIGGAGITSYTAGPPAITVTPVAPTPGVPGVNCQLPPSAPGSFTFPLTNHTVSGVWLQYLQAHGDVDILGYPRSEVICDPVTSQTVQYFQRAVLEYHPENAVPYQIERRLIVNALYGTTPDPAVNSANPPPGDSFYFTQTGHFVANVAPDGSPTYFKQFFDAHGKESTFGYPVEEPKQRTGTDGVVRWTQHFQAGIMEYHQENDKPGNVPGTNNPYITYRVQLSLIGDQYIIQNHLPFIPTS